MLCVAVGGRCDNVLVETCCILFGFNKATNGTGDRKPKAEFYNGKEHETNGGKRGFVELINQRGEV